MALSGKVAEGFEPVAAALTASLETGEDLGAGLSVIIDGVTVLDVAGGFQDKAQTLPFLPGTLTCIYSCGKAIAAALIMHAVSEGKLSYGAQVSDLWPEFTGGGKEALTVGEALSHQGGLCGFAEEQDPAIWLDWEAAARAIAAMEPLFPPGSASGYHPQTFGYIAGEILRRSTGKGIAATLRSLTKNVICGLTMAEATRVSPMRKPSAPPDLGPVTPLKKAAFLERWSSAAGVSRQRWAAAEIPASNMHATAHGLAEVMQLFATGRFRDQLQVSDGAREAAWNEQICGDDLVLPFNLSWGAGVIRETGGLFGAPKTAVGHYGFGGSMVLADPARGLSMAYVPNAMSPHLLADPRAMALVRAVYETLP